jgi:hypothetical protein
VPRAQVGRLRRDPGTERTGQAGHHYLRPGQRDPAVGRQAVMRDAPVALARVGLADPQAGHCPSAERGGGVDRFARRYPGKPPAGPGSEVARALRDDRDIGREHVPGREQPGMHGHRLQVSAERLPGGHGRDQPASVLERRAGAGEPSRQGAAVLHDVHDTRPAAVITGPFGPLKEAGQDGRESRVQVGHHDGHPADVVRVAEHVVVRRSLLVGPGHGHLQGRVAGLDQVAGQSGIGRQAVGDRDHQGVAAGPEPEIERRGIEQHPVAGLGEPDQGRVGQRPHLRLAHRHVKLDRTGPLTPRPADRAFPPRDHVGSLQASSAALVARQ